MHRLHRLTVVLAAAFILLPLGAHATTYSIQALTGLRSDPSYYAYTHVTTINNLSQVGGSAPSTASTGNEHGFMLIGSTMTDIGVLPGMQYSRVATSNGSGAAAGRSFYDSSSEVRSFLWQNGTMTLIPRVTSDPTNSSYGHSLAIDLNDNNEVLMGPDYPNEDYQGNGIALIYEQNGSLTDLVPLGWPSYARPFAFNTKRQVVGRYFFGFSNGQPIDNNAIIWQQGSGWASLGSLGGQWGTCPLDINPQGQATGWSSVSSPNANHHAFRWTPDIPNALSGHMVDLGTLGGTWSEGKAINAWGHVVGWSYAATGQQHAFVHDCCTMHDLNDLIPAGTGWILQEAVSINDRGEITGVGTLNNVQRCFRLTPSP